MTRIVTSLPYKEFEVANGNFDTTRTTIDRIVIHTEVGFKVGTEITFDNPQSHVSAHYGVNQDGTIDHFLEETYTAYHAGDYAMNQRSIGIEHEDFDKPNDPRPDALYTTSANLVRDICNFYSIPIDRTHIFKHSEVSDNPTGCPDALDVDRIVREAGASTQPSDETLPVKKTDFENMRTKCDAYDPMAAAGYKSLGDIDTKVTELNKEVSDAKNATTQLEKELLDANAFSANQATQIAQIKNDDSQLGVRNLDLGHQVTNLQNVINSHYTRFNVKDEDTYVLAVESLLKPHQDAAKEVSKTMDGLAKAAIDPNPPVQVNWLDKIVNFFKLRVR